MQDTRERVSEGVRHYIPGIISAVSVATAATVIAHYKHKYGGDVLFTVSPDVMNSLHREGTAVLQRLGDGHYTLTTLPY